MAVPVNQDVLGNPTEQPVKKQAMSMDAYANQLLTQKADDRKVQFENLQNELKASIPKFKGVSTGWSDKDNFNPAIKSGKDPLSKESRNKLGIYESYIGQAPALYDPMRFTEALSLAKYGTDPFFNHQLNQTLDAYNKAAVKSGFAGQIPTEQLKYNAIADSEAQRTQMNFENMMKVLAQDDAMKSSHWGKAYQSYRDMMGDLLTDYGVTTDAYDNDWNKHYSTWRENFNRWIQEQQLELQKQQLALSAKGYGGGGGGSGSGSVEGDVGRVPPGADASGYKPMLYGNTGANTSEYAKLDYDNGWQDWYNAVIAPLMNNVNPNTPLPAPAWQNNPSNYTVEPPSYTQPTPAVSSPAASAISAGSTAGTQLSGAASTNTLAALNKYLKGN